MKCGSSIRLAWFCFSGDFLILKNLLIGFGPSTFQLVTLFIGYSVVSFFCEMVLQCVPSVGDRYSSVLGRTRDTPEGFMTDLLLKRLVRVESMEVLPSKCSAHQVLVTGLEPLTLRCDDMTKVIEQSRRVDVLGSGVVELCAGSGAMGAAMSFLGAKPLLAWDHSPLSAQHLRSNQHGHVINACVSDLSALSEAHEVVKHRNFVGAIGFPCQPYSSQGAQRGSHDPRAKTLPIALKNFCLLNPQALITECVSGASTNSEVRSALREFCDIMQFEMKEVQLNLKSKWPMQRARWWCLLLPQEWSQVQLKPWEVKVPQPVVRDVLPQWGEWPIHQERELLPSAQEMDDLFNPQHGGDRRILDLGDVCATVLHSYAVTHEGCPCGCRDLAFSRLSLLNKGLRGFLIRSPSTNQLRFLHPLELAVLMGIPPTMEFNQPLRASLCLLGNAASPVQCLWIYSHLILGASRWVPNLRGVRPNIVLELYGKEIYKQSLQHVAGLEEQRLWLEIPAADESTLKLYCQGSATIAQLLKAEHIALEWGFVQQVKEGVLSLPDDFPLSQIDSQDVHLERHAKRQRTDPPSGPLVIGITHGEQLYMVFLQAGDFLFEVLRRQGLHHVHWLLDETGQIFSADSRIWESQKLVTLHEPSFPALQWTSFPARKANGMGQGSEVGLSAKVVGMAAKALLHQVYGKKGPSLVSPFWIDEVGCNEWPFEVDSFLTAWEKGDGYVIIPIAHEKHWLLIIGQEVNGYMKFTHLDGLLTRTPVPVLDFLARFTKLIGCHGAKIQVKQEIRQHDVHTCGSVLLAHLCLCLGLKGRFLPDHIRHLHGWLCQHDDQTLPKANGPEVANLLAELLESKGVDPRASHERASAAIKAIGLKEIQSAMIAKNPWSALKSAANRPNIAFKYVTPEELQQHVQTRAKQLHGASTGAKTFVKSKKKKSTPFDPGMLDPKHIRLIEGHFVDEEDEAVKQIPMSSVVKDATGLALCGIDEATPFLTHLTNLSTSPLALLIIDDLRDCDLSYAHATKLRFSALYMVTEEPMMLLGWLLNLGDQLVQKRQLDDPMKHNELVPTEVVKISFFRDELECEWSLIVNNPIRTLLKLMPAFQMCREEGCGAQCDRYHAPVDEDMQKVIHEVWGRRYQSLGGAEAKADRSEVYVAFLRVQQCALMDLLRGSVKGLYVEPRDPVAKGASKDFVVIWISEDSAEEATHRLRTTEGAIGLARNKGRYGIRVKADQEEQAYKSLHPNQEFVKVNIQNIYRLHPLPFGLQKPAIQKLLREWSWSARALQPSRGGALGGAWTVGASHPPPSLIMTGYGRDILITCLRQRDEGSQEEPLIVQRKTKASVCRNGDLNAKSQVLDKKIDPLTAPGSDPWQQWLNKHKVNTPMATPVRSRIDEVTKELRESVKGMVQTELHNSDSSSSTGANEAIQKVNDKRFDKLETGMKELQVQNGKFQAWFQETGTRLQSTEKQMQIFSSALETTQSEVRQVQQDVKTSAESVHQSFENLQGSIGRDIESKFASFAETIEGMLGKRRTLE